MDAIEHLGMIYGHSGHKSAFFGLNLCTQLIFTSIYSLKYDILFEKLTFELVFSGQDKLERFFIFVRKERNFTTE